MQLSDISKQAVTEIKQLTEYKQLQAAKAALNQNAQLKNIMDTFQNKEIEILQSQLPQSEIKTRLEVLYKQFEPYSKQPVITQYLKSSEQFNQAMDQFYRLISQQLT